MNANNVRSDGLFDGPKFLPDWDGIWEGKATLTEDGWTAEMAIPMKTLSFPAGNDTWGFNVSREVARKVERISWVSRNRTIDPSASGEIYGLEELDTGLGLDVVPSVSLGQRKDFDEASSETAFEPSLDVFYKITPSMNGSLTINTDFAATEVDARQINLTRFSLFFPEKRRFFLKDTDIFEFGRIGAASTNAGFPTGAEQNGRPFFSRTIGLSDDGMPIPLDVGAKISGRVGEWNLGALAVRQAEALSLEAQDLFVGRVTRNVLDKSTVGLIVTHGDPQSSVDNSLAGMDFRYQNTDTPLGVIEAEAWYQLTDTERLNDRNRAWGVGARVPNQTGFRGGVAAREIQENFNPALGFVNQHGVRAYTGDFGYTFRPKGRYLNEIYTGFEVEHIGRISGGTESAATRIRFLEMNNHRGDRLGFRLVRQQEGLLEPFEIFPGIIIEPGNYEWNNLGAFLRTAQHRTLSLNVATFLGNDYEGRKRAGRFGFNWKPSRHFGLEGSIQYSDYELPQGDFFTRLMSLKASVIFSDTLSWINLAQFDNQSNLLGINSRLHWIPKAGRELFFVINHELMDEVTGFRSTNSQITLKVNYTLRF